MSESEDRQKAAQIPIDGRFREMAIEVRRLLGWTDESRPFLTTRMASRKVGINHATISTMARGDRPSVASMMKFAEGLGGDKQLLLRLGGWVSEDDAVNEEAHIQSREITGFIDPDDLFAVAQDNGMSQSEARQLLEMIERRRKERARKQGREE